MHFGYALVVGVTLALLVRRPVWRVLGLAYPLFVLLMIVATGNHFLLDAAAGAVVVGLAVGATALWNRRARWSEPRRAATTRGRPPEPVEAATAGPGARFETPRDRPAVPALVASSECLR
jgi:hypothetical protein